MNQTTATEILTLEEAANYLRLPCLWSGVCWFFDFVEKPQTPLQSGCEGTRFPHAPTGDTH
jgi:hypothetical protein